MRRRMTSHEDEKCLYSSLVCFILLGGDLVTLKK